MAINTISIKSIVQDIFGCTPLAVMSGMGQCVSRGRAGSTQQQHSSTSCQHQRGAAEDDVTESLNLDTDTHTNTKMIMENGEYEDDFDDYDEDFEEAEDDVSSDDGDSDCEETSASNTTTNNNKCAVENKINNNDPEDNNNCDSGLIMDLVPAYRYGRDDSPRQQKL